MEGLAHSFSVVVFALLVLWIIRLRADKRRLKEDISAQGYTNRGLLEEISQVRSYADMFKKKFQDSEERISRLLQENENLISRWNRATSKLDKAKAEIKVLKAEAEIVDHRGRKLLTLEEVGVSTKRSKKKVPGS